MTITGAAAIVQSLLAEGVDVVFGYPGGAVLPIYDELYGADLKHVMVRHEQGAIHAADGYARATGKVGVVFATSGPGATNLITGLATAHMDSSPIVALTGQVATSMIGRDSFQEADVFGLTMPVTKHNYQVRSVEELPQVIHEAFYIASTGRPGPVLIDIPKDIQNDRLEFSYPTGTPRLPGYKPHVKVPLVQVKKAAEAIKRARRPVIFAGGGVIGSGAHAELRELAEKTSIPITLSLMGLGAFPANHSLFLGMPGMHGTFVANRALARADLIIGVGVRFDDRVTGKLERFAQDADVIHIDIDAAEIGKNVSAAIPIVGDAGDVLQQLISLVEPGDYREWFQRIRSWQINHPLRYDQPDKGIAPQDAVREAARVLGSKDVVVTTGVGQHQMWVAQYYPFMEPRRFVNSGGLGTMGFGFPSAVGAQLGHPDKTVLCVDGDGSFQMTSHELATAVKYRLPIISLVLNNGYLGMVRQWQELFYDQRYSSVQLNEDGPDLVKLAQAYGAQGIRVTEFYELAPALRKAAARRSGPTLIDCVVLPEENVYPMVPSGASLEEIVEAPPSQSARADTAD